MIRIWRAAAVLGATVVLLAGFGANALAAGNDLQQVHVLKPRGAHGHGGGGGGANLFSHGGAVETAPAVFISYWGPEWAGTGFSTGGYTSVQAQAYINGFFGGVGGSSWINSTTQYCQNVPSGTVLCSTQASPQYIGNPTGQLTGTWNDTTPVPSRPGTADIANAALRLVGHFGGPVANATYLVFTPSGKSTRGFGTTFCAWHSSTTTSSGQPVAFANMPYQPDAGTACGMNFVNPTNNSFGNGYFDGFSIVGGHEYAEAETDPFPSSGWLDGSGAENGDKCAWISSGQGAATDITPPGSTNFFAVQSLWSNAFNSNAGGCVVSYP